MEACSLHAQNLSGSCVTSEEFFKPAAHSRTLVIYEHIIVQQ